MLILITQKFNSLYNFTKLIHLNHVKLYDIWKSYWFIGMNVLQMLMLLCLGGVFNFSFEDYVVKIKYLSKNHI